jgi:hypothetical protein
MIDVGGVSGRMDKSLARCGNGTDTPYGLARH